jgi:hypothetical protein
MNQTTASFYVKKYVAHYMYQTYGNPQDSTQAIELSQDSLVFNIFKSALTKKWTPGLDKSVKTHLAKLEIKISKSIAQQHGHTINPSMCAYLSGVFEEKIKNELFYEISLMVNHLDYNITQAIKAYQTKYNFTEEIFPFDTIKQAYYRKCTPIKNNILPKTVTKS